MLSSARSLYSPTPARIIWVSVFLVLGQLVGKNWRTALLVIHQYTWYVIGALVFIVALIYFIRFVLIRRRKTRYNFE